MEDSIFTKIIKGELPSYKVHEDDKTLAIMDIHPIQPGHVTVITKTQVETFEQLEEDEFVALMKTVHKVAKKLREAFPSKSRIAVHIEGFEVPHVHVKVFPVNNSEEFHNHPATDPDPTPMELAKMSKKLAF